MDERPLLAVFGWNQSVANPPISVGLAPGCPVRFRDPDHGALMTEKGAKPALEDLRMDFRLPPVPADWHCAGHRLILGHGQPANEPGANDR